MSLSTGGRWGIGIAGAVLLGLAGLAAALGWSGLHDRPGTAGLILVLGNKVLPDGTPSRGLQARLDRAVEAYLAEEKPFVIVSGGLGKEGRDEADAMAAYLAAHGVDPVRIVKDHDGWTTYDSARNTAAFLRAHPGHGVTVVSQYFHLPRARYALERFGVGPVYTVHAHLVQWQDLYALGREAAGYVVYHFKRYPPAG